MHGNSIRPVPIARTAIVLIAWLSVVGIASWPASAQEPAGLVSAAKHATSVAAILQDHLENGASVDDAEPDGTTALV